MGAEQVIDAPAARTDDPGTASLLIAARAVRAVGDGFGSLLLPVYLGMLGLDAVAIGVLTTATLLGSAVGTLLAGRLAARFATRTLLLAGTVLMIGTGLVFAGFGGFWPLLVVGFVGTLNPSSGDVSFFLPLEHALLAHAVRPDRRTATFARYSLAGLLAAAFGALGARIPELLAANGGLAPIEGVRAMFVGYGALGIVTALLYRRLPRLDAAAATEEPATPLGPSRGIVWRLAALFSLDACGGGFLVQSMLALWLFERFEIPVATASSVFFWVNLLTAASMLAAPALARRIGLVETMVFTHIPANLCMCVLAFAPSIGVAVGLLLVRSLLTSMDVPARSAYVMAVVTPPERAAAASLTNVPRSLAAAAGPALAGLLLAQSSFGWPLLVGGGMKLVYDGLLLAMFRRVRPREEP